MTVDLTRMIESSRHGGLVNSEWIEQTKDLGATAGMLNTEQDILYNA